MVIQKTAIQKAAIVGAAVELGEVGFFTFGRRQLHAWSDWTYRWPNWPCRWRVIQVSRRHETLVMRRP